MTLFPIIAIGFNVIAAFIGVAIIDKEWMRKIAFAIAFLEIGVLLGMSL